ncbi:MAG: LPXTG cell wall anchor domain-containing protein [Phycisphaeraceae bacterium]
MTAMLLQSDPATGMTHVELGVLGGLCLVGLALVLLGRRLVKPACVVSGAVLGLGAAWIAAGVWPTLATYWIPLLLTGAVAGGLLAGALFRFWVAFAAAAFLALVVPLATLAWQGAPLPMHNGAANGTTNETTTEAGGDEAAGELDNRASALIDEETRRRVEERVDEVGEAAGEFGVAVLESLRGWRRGSATRSRRGGKNWASRVGETCWWARASVGCWACCWAWRCRTRPRRCCRPWRGVCCWCSPAARWRGVWAGRR